MQQPGPNMTADDVNFIGLVVLPSVAILVSTLIAVSLAASERWAARRDRRVAAMAGVMTSLSALEAVQETESKRREIEELTTAAMASLNVAEMLYPRRAEPFFLLLATSIRNSSAQKDRKAISMGVFWAMWLIAEWMGGRISNRQIRDEVRHIPTDHGARWELSAWRHVPMAPVNEDPNPGPREN